MTKFWLFVVMIRGLTYFSPAHHPLIYFKFIGNRFSYHQSCYRADAIVLDKIGFAVIGYFSYLNYIIIPDPLVGMLS